MRKGVAISISLPFKTAEWLDDYAKRKGMKRSHVVVEALRRMQQREKDKA